MKKIISLLLLMSFAFASLAFAEGTIAAGENANGKKVYFAGPMFN